MQERLIHRIAQMLSFGQSREEIHQTIMEDQDPPSESIFYLAFQAAKMINPLFEAS